MAVDDVLQKAYLERLAPLGDVTTRKMFGGAGYWEAGDMFALLDATSTLYFKVDDISRAMYEAAGSRPFTPPVRGRPPTEMPYMSVPPEVLEDDDRFEAWAGVAIAVGHATAASRRKSQV